MDGVTNLETDGQKDLRLAAEYILALKNNGIANQNFGTGFPINLSSWGDIPGPGHTAKAIPISPDTCNKMISSDTAHLVPGIGVDKFNLWDDIHFFEDEVNAQNLAKQAANAMEKITEISNMVLRDAVIRGTVRKETNWTNAILKLWGEKDYHNIVGVMQREEKFTSKDRVDLVVEFAKAHWGNVSSPKSMAYVVVAEYKCFTGDKEPAQPKPINLVVGQMAHYATLITGSTQAMRPMAMMLVYTIDRIVRVRADAQKSVVSSYRQVHSCFWPLKRFIYHKSKEYTDDNRIFYAKPIQIQSHSKKKVRRFDDSDDYDDDDDDGGHGDNASNKKSRGRSGVRGNSTTREGGGRSGRDERDSGDTRGVGGGGSKGNGQNSIANGPKSGFTGGDRNYEGDGKGEGGGARKGGATGGNGGKSSATGPSSTSGGARGSSRLRNDKSSDDVEQELSDGDMVLTEDGRKHRFQSGDPADPQHEVNFVLIRNDKALPNTSWQQYVNDTTISKKQINSLNPKSLGGDLYDANHIVLRQGRDWFILQENLPFPSRNPGGEPALYMEVTPVVSILHRFCAIQVRKPDVGGRKGEWLLNGRWRLGVIGAVAVNAENIKFRLDLPGPSKTQNKFDKGIATVEIRWDGTGNIEQSVLADSQTGKFTARVALRAYDDSRANEMVDTGDLNLCADICIFFWTALHIATPEPMMHTSIKMMERNSQSIISALSEEIRDYKLKIVKYKNIYRQSIELENDYKRKLSSTEEALTKRNLSIKSMEHTINYLRIELAKQPSNKGKEEAVGGYGIKNDTGLSLQQQLNHVNNEIGRYKMENEALGDERKGLLEKNKKLININDIVKRDNYRNHERYEDYMKRCGELEKSANTENIRHMDEIKAIKERHHNEINTMEKDHADAIVTATRILAALQPLDESEESAGTSVNQDGVNLLAMAAELVSEKQTVAALKVRVAMAETAETTLKAELVKAEQALTAYALTDQVEKSILQSQGNQGGSSANLSNLSETEQQQKLHDLSLELRVIQRLQNDFSKLPEFNTSRIEGGSVVNSSNRTSNDEIMALKMECNKLKERNTQLEATLVLVNDNAEYEISSQRNQLLNALASQTPDNVDWSRTEMDTEEGGSSKDAPTRENNQIVRLRNLCTDLTTRNKELETELALLREENLSNTEMDTGEGGSSKHASNRGQEHARIVRLNKVCNDLRTNNIALKAEVASVRKGFESEITRRFTKWKQAEKDELNKDWDARVVELDKKYQIYLDEHKTLTLRVRTLTAANVLLQARLDGNIPGNVLNQNGEGTTHVWNDEL